MLSKVLNIFLGVFLISSVSLADCPERFEETTDGRMLTEEWLQVMESGVSLYETEPEYGNYINPAEALVNAMKEALELDFQCQSATLAEELADDAIRLGFNFQD